MAERECLLCGGPMGEWDDTETCSDQCMDAGIYLSERQWPIGLALSIRRLVRRAEVDGLVRTVRGQTDLAARHTAVGEMNGDEVDAALDRLAAMAKGEE